MQLITLIYQSFFTAKIDFVLHINMNRRGKVNVNLYDTESKIAKRHKKEAN